MNEKGNIVVKNPSAFWLPKVKTVDEIGDTEYTVTGSYDGEETLDKKQRDNPMKNRKIFYNTHPAIISLEVFDKVQEIRQQRHRRTATGKSNMFSGLVFCDDCKQKLYHSTTNYFEKRQDFFICSTHRTKKKCNGHYIRAVVLEQQV